MRANDVLIKWTGSKRIQAPRIIKHFPKSIKTYYEPFLGGGSMLFVLLTSKVKVERYVGSDLNSDLIGIWKTVRDEPNKLVQFYRDHWPMTKEVYQKIRSEHNQEADPCKFFTLLRTCRNGLVRYNQQDKFNSAFHFGRSGMTPEKVEKVVRLWHEKIQNVEFCTRDYKELQSEEGDLVYLDPPYKRSNDFRMYFMCHFDFDPFWAWMRLQKGSLFLSLNGFKNEEDCRVDVPVDLYDEAMLIPNGLNKFDQMVHNRVVAEDSLYILQSTSPCGKDST